jgi:hypothetical protein
MIGVVGRSRFTKCGGFFGPLAWRLQALSCGRCSWAGTVQYVKPHQQCNFLSILQNTTSRTSTERKPHKTQRTPNTHGPAHEHPPHDRAWRRHAIGPKKPPHFVKRDLVPPPPPIIVNHWALQKSVFSQNHRIQTEDGHGPKHVVLSF